MPGTHYDNDHSFIEDLSFDLKVVANRMIRNDSFEHLLLNLRSLHGKAFESFNIEGITANDKERVIHACIIAKITSFDKTLFLGGDHQQFLQEILFESLQALLQRYFPGQQLTEEKILRYIKISHPRTYEWIYRNDEESKHKLAIHKRRDNNRRYFRYQAELKYHFIRVGSHEGVEELQGDIYSSGIKHFTQIVNEKLDRLMVNYQKNIHAALAEKFNSAYQLFLVVMERVEYLREVLNGISVGRLSIDAAIGALQETLENEIDCSSLQGNIRTESILRDFDEKIQQISENTLILLKNSTPHRLYEGPVLEKLKIDRDIKAYQKKKKHNNSSLLMSFIDLYHYALLLERIYNSISASNYIIIFPEYWSSNYHDASPGGFSFYSEFLVDVNDILELFFQINISSNPEHPSYEILHQRAKVVRINPKLDLGYYQISCQFLNATEHNMGILRKALQSKEVVDAFESASLIDE